MTGTLPLLVSAAGASLVQSIKQLPARRRDRVLAFSRYSQAADLANGVAWYAALGIGTAVLTLAAAIAGLPAHPATLAAVAPWAAVGATVAHSLATARAAPVNFRQRQVGDDEAALGQLFDRFERWQTFRAACQVLALVAVLIALAAALP